MRSTGASTPIAGMRIRELSTTGTAATGGASTGAATGAGRAGTLKLAVGAAGTATVVAAAAPIVSGTSAPIVSGTSAALSVAGTIAMGASSPSNPLGYTCYGGPCGGVAGKIN